MIPLLPSSGYNFCNYFGFFCRTEHWLILFAKKVLVEVMERKLQDQDLNLRVTNRRSVGLLYCDKCPSFWQIFQDVYSPHPAKKSLAQKLILLSYSNLFRNSVHVRMLYDIMDSLSMDYLSRQQLLSLTISRTKLVIRILKRSLVHVNITALILNLKRRDPRYSVILQYEISMQQKWMRSLIIFPTT